MSDYELSQTMIARAESAMASGDADAAKAHYAAAGALQLAWVATLTDDKPRTRSVFTASAVALLYKAGDFGAVRRIATDALAQPWLISHSAMRIREVLVMLPPPV